MFIALIKHSCFSRMGCGYAFWHSIIEVNSACARGIGHDVSTICRDKSLEVGL